MTEYDFSPAAIAAHHEKLAGIAQWTQNVPTKPQQLANPFLPRPRPADETDFYRSHSSPRDRSKRKKDKKRSSKSHGPSRARGYETEDYSDSSSDDGGPDRPPTPPVSAPIYPGGGGYYTSPWPQQQQVYPAQTNVLVPTWNGMTWVYASPQAASPPTQYPPNAYDNRGRDKHRDSGRHHSSSRHPRPKPSRRNSQSVPPVSYTSPGGYTIIYPGAQQPQPQPQSQSTSANTTPSPASAWTSPLPVSPGMYGTPTPAAVGSGGGGYFSPQYTSPNQRTPQQTFYPPPPMFSPPVPGVHVQSPTGSVYSAGWYGSPQVSGYGGSYSAGVPGVYPGMGYAGGAGQYPYGQQPLVIVDGARPRKGGGSGAASMKSGKSGRSLFQKLTGGM
ncbi:hypothetical protein D9611_007566 [Ephemerocybe angulata]|uniref:Uncharacterized protein n=1 Tax=Ephemerocybe angulata TaxID=980116 RepID=A0A8H5FCN5_9AGAR|nr:hypothetical protein D9611_007566 [Tulosesus angulatus]